VDLFRNSLRRVDVTFQNLNSSEISLTDVSHYFDSGPTKVVQSLGDDKKKPKAFIPDTTTANGQVRHSPPGSSFSSSLSPSSSPSRSRLSSSNSVIHALLRRHRVSTP
jgi:hypothetical protein